MVPNMFDPPEHTRYRKILQPLFSPNVLKELSPALTRQAGALIDGVAADGGCDAVSAIAFPYATQAFMTLCGLPPEHADRLISWKQAILQRDPAERSDAYLAASFGLFGYLSDAIRQRRENPDEFPGILSRLLTVLPDAEAIGLSVVLVLGDGVATAIGFVLLALAADPQLRDLLRADPEQVRVFVEEILRLQGPVSGVGRVTTRDVTIGDVTIPAGSTVALRVGAANREDSDVLSVAGGQIARHRHWSFGAGPHRCLGAYLARMELTVLVTEWLRRIPEFEVEPGYSPPLYDSVFNAGEYALPSLPLRWGRPASTAPTDAGLFSMACQSWQAWSGRASGEQGRPDQLSRIS